MEKNLHPIDELFRSALDEYEEMPSSKLWTAVETRLDKDSIVAIKSKYNRLKRIAFLMLLLLIGTGIYELSRNVVNNSIAKRNPGNYENFTGDSKQTLPATGNAYPKQPANSNNVSQKPGKDLSNPFLPLNKRQLSRTRNNIENTLTQTIPSYFNSLDGKSVMQPVEQTKIHGLRNESIPSRYLIPRKQFSFTSPGSPLYIDPKKQGPQPIQTGRTRASRFSIAVFFSPDLATYRLKDDDYGNQPDNANKIEKTESHEFSSTSGVWAGYRLTDKWSIQSGISFSNTNIMLKPKTIYAQPDNNGEIKYRLNFSSGYSFILPAFQNTPVIGDSLTATAAAHKLRYISIPVAVSYRITKGMFSMDAMTGLSVNFLKAGMLETEVRDGANNEIDILTDIRGLKSSYFTWLAGIGTEYRLTNKLSLTITPTVRLALTSINKGSVVRSYPNSFGLVGGVKMRF